MLREIIVTTVLMVCCVAPGHASDGAALPEALREAFLRVDDLGLAQIADADFVKVSLEEAWAGRRSEGISRTGWRLAADDDSVTVLQQGVMPEVYRKTGTTVAPASWNPDVLTLNSVEKADFEALCEELLTPVDVNSEEYLRSRIYRPGPSYRFLVAYAAWRKGMRGYCEPIVVGDPDYEGDMDAFIKNAFEDMAWVQYLRSVNLLMYADRRDVLANLRLVTRILPKGKHADQARELIAQLEPLVSGETPEADAEEVEPGRASSKADRIALCISQLRDLHCIQISQPGRIGLYDGIVVTKSGPPPEQWPQAMRFGSAKLPTSRLKAMGFDAVPALIEALDDETPTRTVYHWRDFADHRLVWRVSDFAWGLLREITDQSLGEKRSVGFTFSYMNAGQKSKVRADIRAWYDAVRNMSEDDRMFTLFSSDQFDDWIAAGEYFLKKGDLRAVDPLLENLRLAGNFRKGDLCELIGRFGDPRAIAPIRRIMDTAGEPSDRISAAIGLWDLGDDSGVPLAIEYVSAKDQPYGGWEEPVWFLMRTRRADAMEALQSTLLHANGRRAGDVLDAINRSVTGNLWSEWCRPAGCVEICPVLVAAMDRTALTGHTYNDTEMRVKDLAAQAFASLRVGARRRRLPAPFAGRGLFDPLESSEAKRDLQIETLKKWYLDNEARLMWDEARHVLVLEPAPSDGK